MDLSVQRDHTSGIDHDQIAFFDILHGNKDVSVLRPLPYPVYLQTHAPRKVIHGFLAGPLIQIIPELKQKHHGTRRLIIAGQNAHTDRDTIEQIHSDLSAKKTTKSLCHIGQGLYRMDHPAKRRGKIQALDISAKDMKKDLFLIDPV